MEGREREGGREGDRKVPALALVELLPAPVPETPPLPPPLSRRPASACHSPWPAQPTAAAPLSVRRSRTRVCLGREI